MEKLEHELFETCVRESRDTDELTACFRSAVMIERVKKRLHGVPIARYDKKRRLPYLEYPDGRKVYEDAE